MGTPITEGLSMMSYPFRKLLWISAAAHLVIFLLIVYSPAFSSLFPDSKKGQIVVNITFGTGENPSNSAFKKTKNMPYSTLKEQKKAMKDLTKIKKGKDTTTFESQNKKVTKTQPDQKIASTGGINPKVKTKQEQTIDDALKWAQEQSQKEKLQPEAAQVENEGDGQSPYGSLDNQMGEVDAILAAYVGEIKRKISNEWITMPKEVEVGQSLITKVKVKINETGQIIATILDQRSGDLSFDLSALRAVERASPFPTPPENIKEVAVGEGFLIEFNPQSVVTH